MSIEVRWGSATHVGCVRAVNQDAILAGPTVFAVADGMGGHAAGEVASGIAIATMANLETGASGSEVLTAVGAANAAVAEQGSPGTGREGMGTTISGIALAARDGSDGVLVFNVGDSRAYLLDGRGLTQLTNDHSLVAEMVRDGELAPDEASSHNARNVVTRALGIAPTVEIDHWWVDAEIGQVYLLCSDGLSNEVAPAVIEAILRSSTTPQAAVDALVGIALDNGARDNVSAIAVRVEHVDTTVSAIEEDTSRRRPLGGGLGGDAAVQAPVETELAPPLIEVVPGAPTGVAANSPPAVALFTDVPSGDVPEPPLGE